MINQNILPMFKSHQGSPSYSIIVKDIECEKNECNQESVIFTVYQIGKDIDELILNEDVVSRKLNIVSDLALNSENIYHSTLTGYLSDEKNITPEQSESDNPLNHYIEIVDVELNKNIDIDFKKEYESKPKIIINVEEKYESLYRTYSLTYKEKLFENSENDTIEEVRKYNGVSIKFNNLKKMKHYPIISIIIIGDLKEE